MATLWAKYQPNKWEEVIGQDAAVADIRESIIKDGWGGRAWWIVGRSGTGCTTIARLLCQEGADAERIRSISGQGVDTAMAMRVARENPGKEAKVVNRAYIIDCPAWASPETTRLLSSALPALHKSICVVFTMPTEEEKAYFANPALDSELIRSCRRIVLAQDGLEKPFAKRCKEIAELEGLEARDLSYYEALALRCHCSMRGMLNAVAQNHRP